MSTHCCVQAKLRTLPYERENNISLKAIRLFLLSIKSHVMSLIKSLASSTGIKSGTNQLGSGSVCTQSFWKGHTCLGNPFLESLHLLHRGPLSTNHIDCLLNCFRNNQEHLSGTV